MTTWIGSGVPNQPRPDNPTRQVRVEDGLWRAAREAAKAQGETVSAVIRRALEAYVEESRSSSSPPT